MLRRQLSGHFSLLGEVHFSWAFITFRVSYKFLLQSANSLRPSLLLFEMFGASIKASTHALAIMRGWPNCSSSNHIAFVTPPGVPSNPATAFYVILKKLLRMRHPLCIRQIHTSYILVKFQGLVDL